MTRTAFAQALLTAAAVVLLAAVNIQLLDDGARPAGQDGGDSGAPPPLPEEPKSSGARALVDSFDDSSRRMETHLRAVRGELADASGATDALTGIPPQLERLTLESSRAARTLGSLDGAVSALVPLGGAASAFQQLPASLDRLAGPLGELAPLHDQLGALNSHTRDLILAVRPLAETTGSTRDEISRLRSSVEETNVELRRLARCLETPVVCRGADGQPR